MNAANRKAILKLIDASHSKVESFYPESAVYKNTPEWAEKRRLLLSDLSLHLAQDALKEESINEASLQNHLFAILKICAEFFPEGSYAEAAALIDKSIATRH
ncbi:hypothetical protein [Pontibacter arcticus]|uniref:Uncharacterized protein n=1 Tax=Pontibacter arcticus TaxID=2080288 RepID=A0A364RBP8_9BACT|nr:hypothetical protein [Pontibacter arcticus]RAU81677.1 hypothetical protein DP923_13270 [Pontibacter arcticus]